MQVPPPRAFLLVGGDRCSQRHSHTLGKDEPRVQLVANVAGEELAQS